MGVSGNAPAAPEDCYGYSVPDSLQFSDSVRISSELKAKLDTATESDLIGLSFGLLPFPEYQIPDSCHNVYCPGAYDTTASHFYKIWNQKLFTDYEIFSSPFTLQRVTPEQVGVSYRYNLLFARKSTILAFSKECYLRGVGSSYVLASALIPQRIGSPQAAKSRFDALGRNPNTQRIPLNLLSTPTFTPR